MVPETKFILAGPTLNPGMNLEFLRCLDACNIVRYSVVNNNSDAIQLLVARKQWCNIAFIFFHHALKTQNYSQPITVDLYYVYFLLSVFTPCYHCDVLSCARFYFMFIICVLCSVVDLHRKGRMLITPCNFTPFVCVQSLLWSAQTES